MTLILDHRSKPAFWPVDRGFVDPKWDFWWQHITRCGLFWEGGGEVIDSVTGNPWSEHVGISAGNHKRWTWSPLGLAQDTINQNEHWALGSTADVFPSTDRGTIVGVFTNTIVDSRYFSSNYQGGTPQSWLVNAQCPWGDGAMYWDWGGVGAGQRITTPALSWSWNEVYYVCLVAGPRGSSIWRNGKKEASQGAAVSRTQTTNLFSYNGSFVNSTASYNRRHIMFATFDDEWSDKQVMQWFADPLGAVRPQYDMGQFFVPAAGGPFTVPLGLVSEADTAQPLSPAKLRGLGLAAEADTTFSVLPAKLRGLGQAIEVDVAQALTESKLRSLGQAVETDISFPLVVVHGGTVLLGQAIETDSAFGLLATKLRTLGLVSEADTAFALTPISGVVAAIGEAGQVFSVSAEPRTFTVTAEPRTFKVT